MESKFKISNVFSLVFPTILMMSFMSLYTIVDGAFVSRFIGTDALSAVNIAYPYVNFILGISIMLGSGGCALVMKKLGEGKEIEAKKDFSFIVLFTFSISIIITIISIIFIEYILKILQAENSLYNYTKNYLFYMIIFTTPTMLKYIVEQFLVAINKSKIALILSVSGGILNILLDYLFIVIFNFGIKGAAMATGLGYAVPALIGLSFFIKKTSLLHFVTPTKDKNVILKSCSNGSSEMISQLSSGIITFLFNVIMLKYVGEDGVAAITIILYIQYLVTAIFLGYSIGVAPRISFFYGNKDIPMLKSLISISIKLVFLISFIAYIVIISSSSFLISFFTEPGTNVYNLTMNGLKIYSISFLIVGILIFISGMFTAFSNGRVSAIISFLRALVFESTGIVVLPIFFGVTGAWLAVPMARLLGALVCLYYYKKFKPIYNY